MRGRARTRGLTPSCRSATWRCARTTIPRPARRFRKRWRSFARSMTSSGSPRRVQNFGGRLAPSRRVRQGSADARRGTRAHPCPRQLHLVSRVGCATWPICTRTPATFRLPPPRTRRPSRRRARDDDNHEAAYALRGLGHLARGQGQYARAEEHLRESLTLLKPLKDRRCIPLTLEGLACITVGPGWADRAATLLGRRRGDAGADRCAKSAVDARRLPADRRRCPPGARRRALRGRLGRRRGDEPGRSRRPGARGAPPTTQAARRRAAHQEHAASGTCASRRTR